MTDTLLKLRAEDAEDMQVISAVLQDSIVPVCDMAFQAESGSFVAVAQRLRRETGEEVGAERICCALTIKGVTEAHTHGIDRHEKERMLDLLAVILESPASLSLIFADDARIRLSLAGWAVAIEDFGLPWPALCRPCHEDAISR